MRPGAAALRPPPSNFLKSEQLPLPPARAADRLSRMPDTPRLLLAAACALLALTARAREDAVYVWRMQNDEALVRAVKAENGARLLALAAEITPVDGTPRVRRAASAAVTKTAGKTFTPVVRAGRPRGDFAADTAWRTAVENETVRAVTTSPEKSVQLDFDCPQAKLAEYAEFISGIKLRHPGIRISITGMPCWLDEPGLKKLLDAADGWTLQVHLTDLPTSAASIPALCDTARARKWMRRAAALEKPFRVALPTYAYLAHFDADGKFAGIEAETPKARPVGHTFTTWTPDYPAIAALVRELAPAPPTGFEGIDWFRLPVEGDRLNLTAAVFAKLRRGEAPLPGKISLRTVASDEGRLLDLRLENTGELDADIPGALQADFPAGSPSMYDLPGSRRIRESDTQLVFAPPPGRLRPGESRALGWFRLRSADSQFSLQPVSP